MSRRSRSRSPVSRLRSDFLPNSDKYRSKQSDRRPFRGKTAYDRNRYDSHSSRNTARNRYSSERQFDDLDRKRSAAQDDESSGRDEKREFVLKDPAYVPRGAYFLHDKRVDYGLPHDQSPVRERTDGRRGRGVFKADALLESSEDESDGPKLSSDRRRRHHDSERHATRRKDSHDDRSTAFVGYRNSIAFDDHRSGRRRDFGRPRSSVRTSKRVGDSPPRRQVSPLIWKHDKFEELEKEPIASKKIKSEVRET